MKLAESCACGAGITAEGAPLTCHAEVTEWREMHNQRCHVEQWRRSAGTASGLYEMGFVTTVTNRTDDRRRL